MTTDVAGRLIRTAEWLCFALALGFTLSFIGVSLACLNYPFSLEWMEGQTIDVVQRVRDGLSLYTAPSIDYVPFIYTPYYYYVTAFISLFTGVDFLPGRLVAALCALGVGYVIYEWVRKEGGNKIVAFIGAGLFFATYRLSGRWFDDARIDTMFLFLTLAGMFVFQHHRGFRSELLAAILLTFAFFTKQSALPIALPLLLVGLFTDRRHALITLALTAAMIGASILIFNFLTDGWFVFYTLILPTAQNMDHRAVLHYWRGDLRPTYIAALMTVIFILYWLHRDWRKGLAFLAIALGGIGTSYAARLHMYGYLNVLMPAHAVLALLAGLALAHLSHLPHARYILPAALALVMLQFAKLTYDPFGMIPPKPSAAVGNRFLSEIGKIDGEVFLPDMQFVQTRVGKKSFTLGMAAYDLLRARLGERRYIRDDFAGELAEAIRSQRFAAIVPGHFIFHNLPGLRQYYRFSRHLDYPKGFVTGAVNFNHMDLYVPADNVQYPIDNAPDDTDDSPAINPDEP